MPPVMSTRRTVHQSFRLSRPGVLIGHRVKPRLERLDTVTSLGKLFGLWLYCAIGMALVLAIMAITHEPNHPFHAGGPSELGIILIVVVVPLTILGWFAMTDWLLIHYIRPWLVRRGILTLEEAEWYPLDQSFSWRYRTRSWGGKVEQTPWPLEWQERIPESTEDSGR